MAIVAEQNSRASTGKSWLQRVLDLIQSWLERAKTFYNDVRTEMKKVTNPSFKEVQATTAVVIITVFLFGVYFFVVDKAIGTGIDALFKHFGHH